MGSRLSYAVSNQFLFKYFKFYQVVFCFFFVCDTGFKMFDGGKQCACSQHKKRLKLIYQEIIYMKVFVESDAQS